VDSFWNPSIGQASDFRIILLPGPVPYLRSGLSINGTLWIVYGLSLYDLGQKVKKKGYEDGEPEKLLRDSFLFQERADNERSMEDSDPRLGRWLRFGSDFGMGLQNNSVQAGIISYPAIFHIELFQKWT